jgi:hypothetical protein
MKTYEIFTEDGSKIIQAKNMASAIGKHAKMPIGKNTASLMNGL